MAAHSDPKTTRMYDRRSDVISLDEKIGIWLVHVADLHGFCHMFGSAKGLKMARSRDRNILHYEWRLMCCAVAH